MIESASNSTLEARRSPRITADAVFTAADALLAEGAKPTIQGVRAKLGRGSPNTIQIYLDEWWAALGPRVLGSPTQSLDLPKPVSDSLLQLWGVALREAQKTLQSSLSEREGAADLRTSELNEREAAIAARERAVDEVQAHLNQSLATARGQVDDQKEHIRELDERLREAAEHEHAAAKREQHLSDQLGNTQREVQESLAQRLKDRAEFDRHIAATDTRALREIDRAREESKELRRKSSEMEKALRAELLTEREERRRLHVMIIRLQQVGQKTTSGANALKRMDSTQRRERSARARKTLPPYKRR